MTAASASPRRRRTRRTGLRVALAVGVAVLVLALIALDTTVVPIGSELDARQQAFDPAAWAAAEFPRIRAAIEERAIPAAELAAAIAADPARAAEEFGVMSSGMPVYAVTFSGTAGEARSGVYDVTVEGLEGIRVRVQTGPAINGTDVRDATGTVAFGDFRNQIEYQDAGAALNNRVREDVLAGIDTANLTGRTVTVTGVFRLVNPENWLVTPVRMSVP